MVDAEFSGKSAVPRGGAVMIHYDTSLFLTGTKTRIKKLTLEGVATKCTDKEMMTMLFDALQGASHLELNVAKLTEIDDSFLLLLCAIHRLSQLYGKKFKLVGEFTAAMKYRSCDNWCSGNGPCLYDAAKRCIVKRLIHKSTVIKRSTPMNRRGISP
jgi:ABC-type transporter Mla MlaB component